MTDKINIELEEWQVRTLRSYFGQNDETQVAHWAFKVFDEALKQQCDIPVVSQQSELLERLDKLENWAYNKANEDDLKFLNSIYRSDNCG